MPGRQEAAIWHGAIVTLGSTYDYLTVSKRLVVITEIEIQKRDIKKQVISLIVSFLTSGQQAY